jgi:hypothetical protein
MLHLLPNLIAEPGVFSDAEAVGAPVSYQRCDAQQEFEDVSYPQKQELSKDEDEGETCTLCACFHLFSEAAEPRANIAISFIFVLDFQMWLSLRMRS